MDLQERITALEKRLSDLEAMEGIRDTIGRYARAQDIGQDDEMAAIMTDDILLRPGSWWPEQKGKENALKTFRDYRASFQHRCRYSMNEHIHIDGKTGTCTAYFLVVHSNGGQSYIGWGTYDWEFRLEEGTWKMAKMFITIDTMTSLEKGWGMEEGRVISLPPHS